MHIMPDCHCVLRVILRCSHVTRARTTCIFKTHAPSRLTYDFSDFPLDAARAYGLVALRSAPLLLRLCRPTVIIIKVDWPAGMWGNAILWFALAVLCSVRMCLLLIQRADEAAADVYVEGSPVSMLRTCCMCVIQIICSRDVLGNTGGNECALKERVDNLDGNWVVKYICAYICVHKNIHTCHLEARVHCTESAIIHWLKCCVDW